MEDPLSYLVSNDLIQRSLFYKRLSREINLDFFEHIPVPINPSKSLSQRIPVPVLTKAMAIPFEQDDTCYLAVSTPYISQDAIANILSYTTYSKCTIVMSHPNEIKRAIGFTQLTLTKIVARDFISTLFADRSVKANQTFYSTQIVVLVLAGIFSVLFLFFYNSLVFAFFFIVFNIMYFIINPVRIFTFLKSFTSKKLVQVDEDRLASVSEESLPVYTVLVPLRQEASIVPGLINSMKAMDYPKEKLDVKFILEIDDTETIKTLQNEGIGLSEQDAKDTDFWAEIVKVPPDGGLSTKPRACNYAFAFARGTYTVIFDAEDRPDPDQLKKAHIGFRKTSLQTVCLQAKLNFYNSRQNLLTRMFSLEYGFWFEYYLPGLDEVNSPLPLGGTSNHFVTSRLQKVGVWDPYNVTEDADLGLRIFRYRFKTTMLDSHTYEEANSRFWNWIRQRTRWQKGFLQTFLIHIRYPKRLYKELGFKQTLLAILTFGTNFFLPLFNPLLWILFIISFIPEYVTITFPDIAEIFILIGLFNLIIGNLTYMSVHIFAAIHMKRYDLVPFALFLPIYWMMISLATYRALWQYTFNRYYWEKTTHGLVRM